MKNKAVLIAAGVLVIAGIGTLAVVMNDRDPAPDQSSSAPRSERRTAANDAASGMAPVDAPNETARAARDRADMRQADLVAMYGESRTNLSRHASETAIGIFDDVLELSDLLINGDLGAAIGGRSNQMMGALGGVGGKLNLTDEQKSSLGDAFTDFQKRGMEEIKTTVGKVKEDPDALMGLFLASDAFARGEITEDEYKSRQEKSGADLEGLMNPLDRENFQRQNALSDPEFERELRATLDPDQLATLDQEMADRAQKQLEAGGEKPDKSPITEIPPMELEKLDSAMTSSRQLVGGFKSIIEAMGNLQGLEQP